MKTHIYCVPGLAASAKIFDYISLPKDKYELHIIEWMLPESEKESLAHYAQRMCATITEKDFILIGVSFGGIVVQEMSKIVSPKKIILISSVKNQSELPKRIKFSKFAKMYTFFPAKEIATNTGIIGYLFGKLAKKRQEKYNQFLSVRDETYLKWSIYNTIHWKQQESISGIVHIHGDKDSVFPIKHIRNCIIIKNGTHSMVIDKGKKVSALLLQTLEN